MSSPLTLHHSFLVLQILHLKSTAEEMLSALRIFYWEEQMFSHKVFDCTNQFQTVKLAAISLGIYLFIFTFHQSPKSIACKTQSTGHLPHFSPPSYSFSLFSKHVDKPYSRVSVYFILLEFTLNIFKHQPAPYSVSSYL